MRNFEFRVFPGCLKSLGKALRNSVLQGALVLALSNIPCHQCRAGMGDAQLHNETFWTRKKSIFGRFHFGHQHYVVDLKLSVMYKQDSLGD